jgi:hypothetical protein
MPDFEVDHGNGKSGNGSALAGRCLPNTHIMSILCNAMQSVVQCRMADLITMHALDEYMVSGNLWR